MATSTKVMFKLETLRQKALESIDFRIAQAQLTRDSYLDDEALKERVVEWRAAQEAKISRLFSRLGETEPISDHELSEFKIDSIPRVNTWDRRDADRILENLKSKRSRIEAKSAAITSDAEGNVALTKTQLDEFFGL